MPARRKGRRPRVLRRLAQLDLLVDPLPARQPGRDSSRRQQRQARMPREIERPWRGRGAQLVLFVREEELDFLVAELERSDESHRVSILCWKHGDLENLAGLDGTLV